MAADLSPEMLAYLTTREQQRQSDIAGAWPQLWTDIEGFVEARRDDATLTGDVALLVRELAIAAYVRGTMHGRFTRADAPTDSFMLYEARETTQSMPDLYPTWALLDGRTATEDGDD